jgi:hypothetical protein
MTAYLSDADALDKIVSFERTALSSTDGHNERWLQERLFTSPKLVPMTEMFGHGEAFVPLCRELPLGFGTSSVFLELLGVSPTGKLVLIECKLWRNPEARREVSSRAVGLFHCSFLGLGRRIHRWCLHVFDRLLRCSTAKMKYRGAMLFAICYFEQFNVGKSDSAAVTTETRGGSVALRDDPILMLDVCEIPVRLERPLAQHFTSDFLCIIDTTEQPDVVIPF